MDTVFWEKYQRLWHLAQREGMTLAEMSLRWFLGDERLDSIVVGFGCKSDVENDIDYLQRGPIGATLQREVDELGIIHPLIYQGRQQL
jgi:aryl-alcohol dehydrogenase-like predicted oxidoreductase